MQSHTDATNAAVVSEQVLAVIDDALTVLRNTGHGAESQGTPATTRQLSLGVFGGEDEVAFFALVGWNQARGATSRAMAAFASQRPTNAPVCVIHWCPSGDRGCDPRRQQDGIGFLDGVAIQSAHVFSAVRGVTHAVCCRAAHGRVPGMASAICDDTQGTPSLCSKDLHARAGVSGDRHMCERQPTQRLLRRGPIVCLRARLVNCIFALQLMHARSCLQV